MTKKEKQDVAFSLQRFWMAIGFSANFFISEQISVPVNLTIMVCFLLIAVFLFVVGDEVETRTTYKFFKRLCCSRGVYWLDENVQVNSSNTTPFPVSCMSIYAHTCTHTHTYTRTHMHTHTRTHTHMDACILFLFTFSGHSSNWCTLPGVHK